MTSIKISYLMPLMPLTAVGEVIWHSGMEQKLVIAIPQ